jgi:coproporphyrinogen III oxidase-like Fe-S oxidoreductase
MVLLIFSVVARASKLLIRRRVFLELRLGLSLKLLAEQNTLSLQNRYILKNPGGVYVHVCVCVRVCLYVCVGARYAMLGLHYI